MPITSYSTLVSELENFLIRSDLTDRIPTFIQLFEARMNRILRSADMENAVTNSTSGAVIALPDDYREARTLYIDADPDITLTAMTLSSLRETYPVAVTGRPTAYAVSGRNLYIAPAPDGTYVYTLTYFQSLPALTSSNTSNWLLAAHPDVYLYGVLTAAEAYLQNDERFPVWKGAWDEALGEIIQEANAQRLPAGPLCVRPTVCE